MKWQAVVGLLMLLGGGVFILFAATTTVSTCVSGTGIETRCTTNLSGLVQAVLLGVAGIVLAAGGTSRFLVGIRAERA